MSRGPAMGFRTREPSGSEARGENDEVTIRSDRAGRESGPKGFLIFPQLISRADTMQANGRGNPDRAAGRQGGARPASSGDLQFISCSQYELVPSHNQLAKASLTRAMREPSGPDISATRGLMTPISQGAPLGEGSRTSRFTMACRRSLRQG